MTGSTQILYSLTLSFYLLTSLLFFLDLKERSKGFFLYTAIGLKVSLFSLTLLLLSRFFSYRYLPAYSFYETILLLTFAGTLGLVLLEALNTNFKKALYFTVPLFTLFLLAAGFFPGEGVELMQELAGTLLLLHVLMVMGAYGVLAVSFMAAILYLLVDFYLKKKKTGDLLVRLPSLDTLDKMNYLLVAAGFVLLTISIILGAVCGERVWGSYWRWEPKEIWALITWLVYAAYIHMRIISGWRGKNIMIINIAGFCAILFNYLVVRFFFNSGFHSFY